MCPTAWSSSSARSRAPGPSATTRAWSTRPTPACSWPASMPSWPRWPPGPRSRVAAVDLLGPDLRHRGARGLERHRQAVPHRCLHPPAVRGAGRPHARRHGRRLRGPLGHLPASSTSAPTSSPTYLRELGVGPDELVGVHCRARHRPPRRRARRATRRAARTCPLDPTYPHDRLEHMIHDSGCRVDRHRVGDPASRCPCRRGPPPSPSSCSTPTTVALDAPARRPARVADAPSEHLAYCIYTSGSTGLPKGVLVEHRNVVNFFAGMDERVAPRACRPRGSPSRACRSTSRCSSCSTRSPAASRVVVYRDRDRGDDVRRRRPSAPSSTRHLPMDFSLFYFSGDEAESSGSDKYRLLLDGARFADAHGFRAVWTPERHFHAFGGLYPQPAVTGAAVAAITERVGIRAGSVVMPLHHPIRVAEAWSIVDNLSNGRVGISIASGWQPNDFVLMPENFADAKEVMFDGIERRASACGAARRSTFAGPTASPVDGRAPCRARCSPSCRSGSRPPATPRPTSRPAGSAPTCSPTCSASRSSSSAPKIAAYREARAEAGFDPDAGHRHADAAHLRRRRRGRGARDRARAAEGVPRHVVLAPQGVRLGVPGLPAARPASTPDDGLADDDFENLSTEELDAVLEFAFVRYYETSGLFGTPDALPRRWSTG